MEELTVRIDSFEILSHFFSINGIFLVHWGPHLFFFLDVQICSQSRSLIFFVPPWFLICTHFELFDMEVESSMAKMNKYSKIEDDENINKFVMLSCDGMPAIFLTTIC